MALSLHTGAKMQTIGLGTFVPHETGVTESAVVAALDCGYRCFDAAWAYRNEEEIGRGLRQRLGKSIKREDVFVMSKLWNTMHAAEDVKPACQQTLNSFGVDYLDCYLIHWPYAFKKVLPGYVPTEDLSLLFPRNPDGTIMVSDVSILETWSAMERLVDEGLCKHIGLSNFNIDQITEILGNCRIKPAVLQTEIHPYLYDSKLIEFCKDNGIAVTAYCPLGSPTNYHPTSVDILHDTTLMALAQKYNKTVAQVVLRFGIQSGISVIPKSQTPSRIAENIQIFDFKLTEEDMNIIRGLHKGECARLCKMTGI